MPVTPLGYPYPNPADAGSGNFPAGMQALAEAVDADMQANIDAIGPIPSALIRNTTPMQVPTGLGSYTLLSFDVVDYDSDGIANLVTDPQGLVPKTAGFYVFQFSLDIPKEPGAFQDIAIFLNGTEFGRRTVDRFFGFSTDVLTVTATGPFNGTTDRITAGYRHNDPNTLIVSRHRMMCTRMAN